jgi:hypothetical protein
MAKSRELRKLQRRRRRLIESAIVVSNQLDWASDFFKGPIAGPRLRNELYERLNEIQDSLESVEKRIEALDG